MNRESNLLRLLRLSDREKIEDPDFQNEVTNVQTLIRQWKIKYGYSSNDERWKSATLSQIFEDMLEADVMEHIRKFERGSKSFNELVKKSAIDPEAADKERQNIADELNRILQWQ